MIRVGIIGTGFGTTVHLPAFRKDPRCQVLAVASQRTERAHLMAEKFKIPRAHENWRDLVHDPEIDLIAVAVPAPAQAEIAKEALGLKKAILCEKPLCSTLEEAHELAAAAHRAGVPNAVDFEFPELATWAEAKKLILSGSLGRLKQISIDWSLEMAAYRSGTNSWKTCSQLGGGALNLLGSHALYNLEWLAGEIAEVRLSLLRAPQDLRPAESIVAGVLLLKDQTPVTVLISTQATGISSHRIHLVGESGALKLENPTDRYLQGFHLDSYRTSNPGWTRLLSEPAGSPDQDERVPAVSQLIRRFLDWVCHPDGPSHDLPTIEKAANIQKWLCQAHAQQSWASPQKTAGEVIRDPKC